MPDARQRHPAVLALAAVLVTAASSWCAGPATATTADDPVVVVDPPPARPQPQVFVEGPAAVPAGEPARFFVGERDDFVGATSFAWTSANGWLVPGQDTGRSVRLAPPPDAEEPTDTVTVVATLADGRLVRGSLDVEVTPAQPETFDLTGSLVAAAGEDAVFTPALSSAAGPAASYTVTTLHGWPVRPGAAPGSWQVGVPADARDGTTERVVVTGRFPDGHGDSRTLDVQVAPAAWRFPDALATHGRRHGDAWAWRACLTGAPADAARDLPLTARVDYAGGRSVALPAGPADPQGCRTLRLAHPLSHGRLRVSWDGTAPYLPGWSGGARVTADLAFAQPTRGVVRLREGRVEGRLRTYADRPVPVRDAELQVRRDGAWVPARTVRVDGTGWFATLLPRSAREVRWRASPADPVAFTGACSPGVRVGER